jgi:hypothetical protein
LQLSANDIFYHMTKGCGRSVKDLVINKLITII